MDCARATRRARASGTPAARAKATDTSVARWWKQPGRQPGSRAGGGPSGSGLFDTQSLLVGTDTAGNGATNGSQCGNRGTYGRLSAGYSALQPWFETDQGGGAIATMKNYPPPGPLSNNGCAAVSSMQFEWNPVPDAIEYRLSIGLSAGLSNVYDSGVTKSTQANTSNISYNGSPVYVRLWTHLPVGWYCQDYTYNTVKPYSYGPAITSPDSGYPLPGTTVTFNIRSSMCTYITGFKIGFKPGANDIYLQGHVRR